MKKHFATTFLCAALLGPVAQRSQASVVIGNLDPSNPAFNLNAPTVGQSILTGNRPISLTSVEFVQTTAPTPGETASVYSRNADGTLGSSLPSAFTLLYDSNSGITTATTSASFTLQANSGYYFVLGSGSTSNLEWSYTSSTDYAAAFGVTIPTTSASFFTAGNTITYRPLSGGPQQFQVNGVALAAVPEPSTGALIIGAGAILLGMIGRPWDRRTRKSLG